MTTQPLPFFSSGLRLDADLHLPEGYEGRVPCPVVVACSGYQGLKVIQPERFARGLTPLGYAVLVFDYRGFGASEGERGRLVPQEWVEDVRAAVDRLGGVDEVDPDRIALLGWGLGGGVVIAEAADDPRVKAVACLNGIGDGARSTRLMHDEGSWSSLLERIVADRVRRASLGRSELTDPWDVVRLNRDARTDAHVTAELYKAPGFGSQVTLESADTLLRFSPERFVDRIAPRPLLLVHGAENGLHPPSEAQSLFARAGEPKRVELLELSGHIEWSLDDHPTFRRVIAVLDDFFREPLNLSVSV